MDSVKNEPDAGGVSLSGLALPKISVVIPTLNEEQNLSYTLPRIPAWVDEVVLVDGGSSDGTVARARALVPDIVVVGQDRPGKGAALRCGFTAARGDIIVALDADGSTDPAEIPAFVGLLIAGADFVKGSRFLQGGKTEDMEWYRFMGNWVLVKLVKLAFGGRFTDLCYGYNAFWRDILPLLNLDRSDGFEIETSMNVQALRAELRIAEVPSSEYLRRHGTSHLRTLPDGWRVFSTIVRLGMSKPARGMTVAFDGRASRARSGERRQRVRLTSSAM